MWPEAARAVREIEPRVFLFENVRGLARAAFADYLNWVLATLSHPRLIKADRESHEEHLSRLRRAEAPLYNVSIMRLNAADYGAAQKRHRVVIVGVHRDLGQNPPQLSPTHSRERLLWDQWISGEYWKRHAIRKPGAGPHRIDVQTVERLRNNMIPPEGKPWRTVRDALNGLGTPGTGNFANHMPQPGARSYPGHTGSSLDMPAKALKAGVHGVPGGENTIALPNGKVRYLTVREAARLQGLPDGYEFIGSWSENMRQLGNAVPTELARAAAGMLAQFLEKSDGTMRKKRAA
jgi:DNA (cytosine-5)-methyltransferase 1